MTGWKVVVIGLIAALPAVPLSFVVWDFATYDSAGWRRDYEHLKRELAQNYANLDWIVAHRHLDLAELDARTSEAIDNAHSRIGAFLALQDFIGSFQDPHLRIHWWRQNTDAQAEPVASSCAAVGYLQEDTVFNLPLDLWPEWNEVSATPFVAGMAGDIGVIRIADFRETSYLNACSLAFRPGLLARELQLATRAHLQMTLRNIIKDFRNRGAKRLVVDLTGNGGGTEWSLEAVALFGDETMRRLPPQLAKASCNRDSVWQGDLPCPVLAPVSDPETIVGEGIWTGPIFLLVDANTGSASEELVAWLIQDRDARVVGKRTAGAGCGYMDHGGWIHLDVAPITVRAPNCARFLDDGTNEIEGIVPDVEIDLDADRTTVAAQLWTVLNATQ